MARRSNEKNNKFYTIAIVAFFVIAITYGIKASYAYYTSSESVSILANLVGDFDMGDGDINMTIYKQDDNGDYIKTYTVPTIGYTFNNAKTVCDVQCSYNDASAACNYSYNTTTKKFTFTSNGKASCKFYFDQEYSTDINIHILIEDENGSTTYNNKSYTEVNAVPAYGYEYYGYTCDETGTVVYNSNTRTFSLTTNQRNTCYAYFDNTNTADIITNVYVQSDDDNTVYNKVDIIPANHVYVLSQSHASSCTDNNSQISYVNGYIQIDSMTQKQTCNVYLDLE